MTDSGTPISQWEVHYPTLPRDIAKRAQARGLDIEKSTDAFLELIRTNRGMRRDLLDQMGVLITPRSRVQQVDDEYLATRLTDREMDVLLGYADGDDSAAIAADLGLSIETVKTHAIHLYSKLGARTRAHAIALAYHSGILKRASPPLSKRRRP